MMPVANPVSRLSFWRSSFFCRYFKLGDSPLMKNRDDVLQSVGTRLAFNDAFATSTVLLPMTLPTILQTNFAGYLPEG